MNRPLVVSRRWDQIGGRLNSLVNALCVAELLGLDMAFTWPPGAPTPSELFGPRILARLVEADGLEGWTPVWHHDPEEAARRCEELGAAYIEVDAPFGMIDVVAGSEGRRFVAAFESIDWHPSLDGARRFLAGWPADGPRTGLHIRAGDVVNGEWRRAMWHEKYVPASSLLSVVAELAAAGRRMVVSTDNEPLARWITRGVEGVEFPADLVPGYYGLSTGQRAVVDLLVLSSCQEVVAPPRSAFSRLAATLCGSSLVRADSTEGCGLAARLDAGMGLLRTAVREEPGGRLLLAPVLARDLVWSVDVLGDRLDGAERLSRLREATGLDPGFVAAWARRARTAAAVGRLGEAATSVRAGRRATRGERVQDDPMVDVLAAQVVVACLGTLSPTAGHLRLLARHRMAGAHRRRTALSRLRPFTVDTGRLGTALDRLTGAVEQLAGDRPAAAAARHWLRAPLPPGLRTAGEEEHRDAETFDALCRELEGISLRVVRASV